MKRRSHLPFEAPLAAPHLDVVVRRRIEDRTIDESKQMTESNFYLMIRMRFFAVSSMLKSLSEPEALERLNRMRSRSHCERRAAGLLAGYKLIVETMLYRQIELIVNFPEILQLPADESLQRWWSNSEPKSAHRFKGFVARGAPNSVFVANHVNELLLRVNRTGNCWDRFVDASAHVWSHAGALLTMARSCHSVPLRERDSVTVPDIGYALRQGGAECLHDFVCDRSDRALTDAYDYVRSGSAGWLQPGMPVVHEMFDVETSKDIVRTVPRRRRSVPKFLVLGIDAAIAITSQAPTSLDRVVWESEGDAPPSEDLFGDLLEAFQTGKWPSTRYGLAVHDKLPEKELRDLMSFETSPADPRERLKTQLGDNAFVVSGASSSAEFHFQTLVSGLATTLPGDRPVEVLQIEHAGSKWDPHPSISLAVRVGGDWHVFYCLDAVGRMKSSVWPMLGDLGDRVEVTKLEGVETKFLLGLCDRAFQHVANQWKSQRNLNSHLRGTIPELLAGLLLVHLNFFPTRIGVEVNGIGELDAVGYKDSAEGGECWIVEVKKRSTNQVELRSEIDRFRGKIDSIRDDPGGVEQVLGRRSGSIAKVAGDLHIDGEGR